MGKQIVDSKLTDVLVELGSNMVEVVYADPIADKVEVSANGLPEGWFVPPMDVSRDVELKPLPFGVVVACSSEESYKKAMQRRLAMQ